MLMLSTLQTYGLLVQLYIMHVRIPLHIYVCVLQHHSAIFTFATFNCGIFAF